MSLFITAESFKIGTSGKHCVTIETICNLKQQVSLLIADNGDTFLRYSVAIFHFAASHNNTKMIPSASLFEFEICFSKRHFMILSEEVPLLVI